jgi:hypothetical protein
LFKEIFPFAVWPLSLAKKKPHEEHFPQKRKTPIKIQEHVKKKQKNSHEERTWHVATQRNWWVVLFRKTPVWIFAYLLEQTRQRQPRTDTCVGDSRPHAWPLFNAPSLETGKAAARCHHHTCVHLRAH